MSQERIRDDTKTQFPDQLTDVLLVVDKINKEIGVATGKMKNGKPETVPLDDQHEKRFMKVDKNNMLENFWSNFLRQNRDPKRFGFFKLSKKAAKIAIRLFRELLKDNPSQEAVNFAKQYEVKPDTKVLEVNNTKNSKMDVEVKDQNTQTQAAQNNQPTNQPGQTEKYQRYNESKINWPDITQKTGITPEFLKQKGMYDDLMKGQRSKYPIPVYISDGAVSFKGEAKISLTERNDGSVGLTMSGIRREPNFETPYFGHKFSAEDQKNLLETGNIGRVVNLTRGKETNPCIISLDPHTREFVGARVDKIRIPDTLCSHEFTHAEKVALRQGKPVEVYDMFRPNTDEMFSAKLQLNALKFGIDFVKDLQQSNKMMIGKVTLSDQQVRDFHEGKAVLVEGMVSKNRPDEPFDSYIKKNPSGKPDYYSFNPDKEGEIIVPKYVYGVKLEHDDRAALGKGETVFLKEMRSPSGDHFDAFVKLNMTTGKTMTSKTQDFDERPSMKIPERILGHKVTAKERGLIQDGNVLHIKDGKGFDQKPLEQWVKLNPNTRKLEYYDSDPAKKAEQKQDTQKQDNKGTKIGV